MWTDGKAEVGREEERRSERRKSEKKEDAGARKGRKVAIHSVFPMICGSGGSKSRLSKAAGAEPCGQMRDEQLHAIVARNRFPSQNVIDTPFWGHFWKLKCRKRARRCGTKDISNSKCTKPKHTILGPVLEVEMSKKCTPFWCEEHFHVEMYKARHSRTTFGSWDVEKVHAVVARSTFPDQNAPTFRRPGVVLCGRRRGLCTLSKVSKTWGFCSSFALNRYTTLHLQHTTLHHSTLHYITHHATTTTTHATTTTNATTCTTTTTTLTTTTILATTTLHYTTLDYTSLHYIALHHITITLHSVHHRTCNCNCTTIATLHHN